MTSETLIDKEEVHPEKRKKTTQEIRERMYFIVPSKFVFTFILVHLLKIFNLLFLYLCLHDFKYENEFCLKCYQIIDFVIDYSNRKKYNSI